jgi:hypothetical protein
LPDDGPVRPKHVATNKTEDMVLITFFLRILNVIVTFKIKRCACIIDGRKRVGEINIEAYAHGEGEVLRMHALSVHGIKWYVIIFCAWTGILIAVLTSRFFWIWRHSRQPLRFETRYTWKKGKSIPVTGRGGP